jgi:COMM domain
VVDLKWRLDYLVSSKDGGKVGAPIYLVELHLQDPSTGKDLPKQQFTCTPPELEELRLKIKDAMRSAQALAAAVGGS